MGEIADMMLDGTLCECCGEFLGDAEDPNWEPPGYPRYCSRQCAENRGVGWEEDDPDFEEMI